MLEKSRKGPCDLLLDLITSDMNLARAFTQVARSAYRLDKKSEGDFARLKAIQLYSEAARLAHQVPESILQKSLGSELQALSTTINWLFVQPSASESTAQVERLPAIENPAMAVGEIEDFIPGE